MLLSFSLGSFDPLIVFETARLCWGLGRVFGVVGGLGIFACRMRESSFFCVNGSSSSLPVQIFGCDCEAVMLLVGYI